MFDAEIVAHIDETPPPALHYCKTDAQLLGQTLAQGAQLSFNKGARVATYDCNGEWVRYIAGGWPFTVRVTAIRPGEPKVFTLENTGDGLTFTFGDPKDHQPQIQAVLAAAKDWASQMPHHV